MMTRVEPVAKIYVGLVKAGVMSQARIEWLLSDWSEAAWDRYCVLRDTDAARKARMA